MAWRLPAAAAPSKTGSGGNGTSGGRRPRAGTTGSVGDPPPSKAARTAAVVPAATPPSQKDKGKDKDKDNKHHLKTTDKNFRDLLRLLLKVNLNTMQNQRDLMAATFDVYQYSVEGELGQKLTGTGQAFAQAIRARKAKKEEGDEEGMAVAADQGKEELPPAFVHFTGTILDWLVTQDIGGGNRQTLTELKSKYEQDWQSMMDHVRLVKTAKCFDTRYRKLFIASTAPLRRPLHDSLKQAGIRHLPGRAPPTGMEKEMENWLSYMLNEA